MWPVLLKPSQVLYTTCWQETNYRDNQWRWNKVVIVTVIWRPGYEIQRFPSDFTFLFCVFIMHFSEMKASLKSASRRRRVHAVARSWSACFGRLCGCLQCVRLGAFECLCARLALVSVFSVQCLPPPYCCRVHVQEGSPVGPRKWACTSKSSAATALEVLLFKARMFSWLVKHESLLSFELRTWQAVIFHQCCITRALIKWDKRM